MALGSLANLCRAGMAIVDIIMKLYFKSRVLEAQRPVNITTTGSKVADFWCCSLRTRPSDL